MRNNFSEPRVDTTTIRTLNERRVTWHPAASQSLIALDPAHWSQRHQQATSWLLVEFLQSQRYLQ